MLKFFRIVERGWIPIPTKRGAVFSLIDVQGLVDATLRALDLQAAQGVYYVSDGLSHTWEDIGALAARVMGVRARHVRVPYPVTWLATLGLEVIARIGGGAPLLSFDKLREMREVSWVCVPDRARRDFGFHPGTDIEKGFEETVRWYREIGWLHSG
jgi:nucleoside-diphosphate-sugar epimerase